MPFQRAGNSCQEVEAATTAVGVAAVRVNRTWYPTQRTYSSQHRTGDRCRPWGRPLLSAVGSVREVVARALREFRLAGLVATGPDSVLIVDPTRLHDQCWSTAAE
jgi:hypothetical protein